MLVSIGIAMEPGRHFMSGDTGTPSWESPRPLLTMVSLPMSTRRTTPLASSFSMTPWVIETICFDTSALLVHVPPMSTWLDEQFALVAAPATVGRAVATRHTIAAATTPRAPDFIITRTCLREWRTTLWRKRVRGARWSGYCTSLTIDTREPAL